MGRSKPLDEISEGPRCQHRGCGRSAKPYITEAIKNWGKGKWYQPRYFCNKHEKLYNKVSATTGEILIPRTKKEVKKRGEAA